MNGVVIQKIDFEHIEISIFNALSNVTEVLKTDMTEQQRAELEIATADLRDALHSVEELANLYGGGTHFNKLKKLVEKYGLGG